MNVHRLFVAGAGVYAAGLAGTVAFFVASVTATVPPIPVGLGLGLAGAPISVLVADRLYAVADVERFQGQLRPIATLALPPLLLVLASVVLTVRIGRGAPRSGRPSSGVASRSSG